MRLEIVWALLVIAVVTIGTSAEDSGSQNDVDDERSVRDALDGDDVQSVLVDDDGRSVRDILDGDDVQSQLGDDDDGRSVRDNSQRCKACNYCRAHRWRINCLYLCRGC